MMQKTQILKWLVVILVLLNIATISTILFHNYKMQNKNIDNTIAINTGYGTNMLNGRFFRQTLGFNQQQMDSFRNINQAFRPNAMDLTYRIDSVKEKMFIELQKTAPDTIVLHAMSAQIGELHSQLKYKTGMFYLRLKRFALCSK
ncbi:MAG: hypothetical protein IPP48_17145 [Chitinophagaceae bacterium]|nr:hypothetical protein [Chitinophagaceae bacterium]